MIKAAFKIVAFTFLVLLVGQVRWEGKSIAERLHGALSHSLEKGGEALQENRFVAKLARHLHAESAPRVDKESRGPERETLSDADRESLRRLLQ